ncbi:hypothetical protein KQI84_04010 [bacterium]|nr:hypothetical protein [bacterium]
MKTTAQAEVLTEQEWNEVEHEFLAMARTPTMAPYVGMWSMAGDEELKSIFGVAMAALRQCKRRESASLTQAIDPTVPEEEFENRLEEMSVALAQRDARIRELTLALERQSYKQPAERLSAGSSYSETR